MTIAPLNTDGDQMAVRRNLLRCSLASVVYTYIVLSLECQLLAGTEQWQLLRLHVTPFAKLPSWWQARLQPGTYLTHCAMYTLHRVMVFMGNTTVRIFSGGGV